MKKIGQEFLKQFEKEFGQQFGGMDAGVQRVQVNQAMSKYSPGNYYRMNPMEFEGDARNAMYGISSGVGTTVQDIMRPRFGPFNDWSDN